MQTQHLPTGCVVVGVDAAQPTDRALDWAADQAALEERHLLLVHGIGSPLVRRLRRGRRRRAPTRCRCSPTSRPPAARCWPGPPHASSPVIPSSSSTSRAPGRPASGAARRLRRRRPDRGRLARSRPRAQRRPRLGERGGRRPGVVPGRGHPPAAQHRAAARRARRHRRDRRVPAGAALRLPARAPARAPADRHAHRLGPVTVPTAPLGVVVDEPALGDGSAADGVRLRPGRPAPRGRDDPRGRARDPGRVPAHPRGRDGPRGRRPPRARRLGALHARVGRRGGAGARLGRDRRRTGASADSRSRLADPGTRGPIGPLDVACGPVAGPRPEDEAGGSPPRERRRHEGCSRHRFHPATRDPGPSRPHPGPRPGAGADRGQRPVPHRHPRGPR